MNYDQAAVFIDCENVRALAKPERTVPTMRIIIDCIQDALHQHAINLCPAYCRIYARGTTKGNGTKRTITEGLRDIGFTMVWTDGIADEALITDIEEALANPAHDPLPLHVVIASHDGDFVTVAKKIQQARRVVWIAGYPTLKRCRLARKGNCFIALTSQKSIRTQILQQSVRRRRSGHARRILNPRFDPWPP